MKGCHCMWLRCGCQLRGLLLHSGAAQAAPAASAAPAAEDPKAEEKTEFDVKLAGFDAAAKIKVIKEVRSITALGLKEAKELVSPLLLPSADLPSSIC